MPLTACPECQRESVSSLAEACPGCGAPVRKLLERARRAVRASAPKRYCPDTSLGHVCGDLIIGSGSKCLKCNGRDMLDTGLPPAERARLTAHRKAFAAEHRAEARKELKSGMRVLTPEDAGEDGSNSS